MILPSFLVAISSAKISKIGSSIRVHEDRRLRASFRAGCRNVVLVGLSCFALLTIHAGVAAGACAKSEPGYDMWFMGRVVVVNIHRGTVTIAHGPAETEGPSTVLCESPRRVLRHLHHGMRVAVEVDTRRRPWRILKLRPVERFDRGRATAL